MIPALLSALLGPGMGQLYNRQYKKGISLLILSLIALVPMGIWLVQATLASLPVDVETVDPAAFQDLGRKAITQALSGRGATFYISEFALLALWIYGIVDAYRGGQRRRAAALK